MKDGINIHTYKYTHIYMIYIYAHIQAHYIYMYIHSGILLSHYHFVMYVNVKSLCSIPETNTILYFNYILLKKKKNLPSL